MRPESVCALSPYAPFFYEPVEGRKQMQMGKPIPICRRMHYDGQPASPTAGSSRLGHG